ncbi:DNA primase [Colwellia sp. 1_MG-2023]|uniref:DNA primase n=1 Tax=unclassified Colwellia TaxID=196834 RepID=UPI001C08B50F|nr:MULTISPECIES: DNA primase [unclassified Colwellia]MBU2924152.1 DNA primase [Colwellia sp. C2M11]MDO6652042.1 DNA primase [Colwellia sp. 3_MG-2023]MDO6664818.1 DNA primase [Colwellia sp. 2_MG-2023]MDO6689140.1 DNA primase [Colwellia sp. 1_MG-2023]
MLGRIPRQFIDDLLARADIVELIDGRVPLKKAGKNYQACCPFHNEKSPSFTVSQDKQFYHCFGCGEHGNAISFLMEFDRLDFVDAIEELASHCGVEVVREENNASPAEQRQQQKVYQQKQDDYELMNQISRFYQQQLKAATDKETAINYLKGRGLSGEVVKRFGIGYISDAWDGMMKVFSPQGKANQQLIDLGMAIQGDKNRPYDRFRGRIMFPIRDKRGRVIAFGGRVLGDEKPKYLNSPETRVYHKGQELYGLYEAKQANKNLERLVVVEGYMDVVALAQHGVDYAVASLGTSTTPEQLQTLFRTVKEVICCYDGDRAGRDAAWRAMENALPLIRDGFSLKFVFVPDGEDPDSLIRKKGQKAFEQILDEAMPLSKFLVEQLMSQVEMNSLEGRAALVDSFQPYLMKMPDSVLKDAIINDIANNFGTGSEQFLAKIAKNINKQEKIKKPQGTTKTTPVRLAIALLLEHPHIVNELGDISALASLQVPGIELLTQLLKLCQQNPEIKTAQLLEYFRGTETGNQLAKLMCWQHHVTAETAADVFLDSIEKLLNDFVEKRTEFLLQKARVKQITLQERQELQAILNA